MKRRNKAHNNEGINTGTILEEIYFKKMSSKLSPQPYKEDPVFTTSQMGKVSITEVRQLASGHMSTQGWVRTTVQVQCFLTAHFFHCAQVQY